MKLSFVERALVKKFFLDEFFRFRMAITSNFKVIHKGTQQYYCIQLDKTWELKVSELTGLGIVK